MPLFTQTPPNDHSELKHERHKPQECRELMPLGKVWTGRSRCPAIAFHALVTLFQIGNTAREEALEPLLSPLQVWIQMEGSHICIFLFKKHSHNQSQPRTISMPKVKDTVALPPVHVQKATTGNGIVFHHTWGLQTRSVGAGQAMWFAQHFLPSTPQHLPPEATGSLYLMVGLAPPATTNCMNGISCSLTLMPT